MGAYNTPNMKIDPHWQCFKKKEPPAMDTDDSVEEYGLFTPNKAILAWIAYNIS